MARDLAVDLGTTTTRIYNPSRGLMVAEPSLVAIHTPTERILAWGEEAGEMLQTRPANVVVTAPLKSGAICDVKTASAMLKRLLRKAIGHPVLLHPRIVVGVSSDATPVEQRAIVETTNRSGASDFLMVAKVVMDAIGAGLPVASPRGSMIIDIGGGTTEIGVVSLGGIVASCVLRKGGNSMDRAIMEQVNRKHHMQISERSAAFIKTALGIGFSSGRYEKMTIAGTNRGNHYTRDINISPLEIYDALQNLLREVVSATRYVLERTPPEIAADIAEHGIVLCGGGALLKGFDKLLAADLGVPVAQAREPLTCVVRGIAAALGSPCLFRRVSDQAVVGPRAA